MYSKTIIVGRLTKDPLERSYGNDNGKMSLFTVAADYGKDQTAFNDCIAFGKTAETINKYFKKGRPILVEGVFQNNDSKRTVNGTEVTNYGMNLVVDRFSFVGGPNDGQDSAGGQASTSKPAYQKPASAPAAKKEAPVAPAADPFAGFGGFDGDDGGDGVPF